MTSKETSAKTLADMSLSAVYLQWVNDFISIEGFADYHGLALDNAVRLIAVARTVHEAQVMADYDAGSKALTSEGEQS